MHANTSTGNELPEAFIALTNWLELDTNAAVSLAIFHTLFNLLGAVIMLPLLQPVREFPTGSRA